MDLCKTQFISDHMADDNRVMTRCDRDWACVSSLEGDTGMYGGDMADITYDKG